MAKKDGSKGSKPVPNKHLHSRISYLYQAACHLSSQDSSTAGSGRASELDSSTDNQVITTADEENQDIIWSSDSAAFPPGLSHHLISHLQSVSRKTQIRLSQDVKRSICKRCSTVLIPGKTSTSRIENLSRGGRKPWADVLVIKCEVCETQKRFPVGAKRQPKKKDRPQTNMPKARVACKKEEAVNERSDSTAVNPIIEDIDMDTPT
ncbi:RNAse P Rpr2/Rpp21/SNM1 subunit domain-containing protein [Phyllosticta citribraziliensis]|uniref:RNAse P Rpr2/Rpp21/SNM1 subunit domain-containing protein n=1 Tax=Phyllosticta citribraziliensis TaxID=989973 RepID=A0ABR1LMN0_9PEZI